MSHIDSFIQLVRDEKLDEAMALLNAHPEIAQERSQQEGQMHGESALHRAAHRNAVELCKRLIELGANVNDAATEWWQTPLSWAADAGSVEAAELLLENGADVNQDAIVGTTALHAVAMGGSSQGTRDPDAYRRTAELLIANGADIHRQTRQDSKQTPLDAALEYQNAVVIEVLKSNGAESSLNT